MLFIQPSDIQMHKHRHMYAQTCIYKEHIYVSTYTCTGSCHLHAHHLYTCPRTDMLAHMQTHTNPHPSNKERFTEIHPHKYSQLWDNCYTHKIVFNIDMYLPMRHICQQRNVDNKIRLTFKEHLVHKPTRFHRYIVTVLQMRKHFEK